MGLIPLFLFTLLGGLGAGVYVAETFLRKDRDENRAWLVPLLAVLMFGLGVGAATFHVSNISHIFSAQINFGAGMVTEVAIAICFFVLALIDLIVTIRKGTCPYVLRIVTAVVGLLSIVTMGTAYMDIYGVGVWTNAPATLLAFFGGDVAMGFALFGLVSKVSYSEIKMKGYGIVAEVVLAVGLLLQIASFSAAGLGIGLLVAGLILAPIVGGILMFSAAKTQPVWLPTLICICVVVGVALARWAFYAACALL